MSPDLNYFGFLLYMHDIGLAEYIDSPNLNKYNSSSSWLVFILVEMCTCFLH